MTPSDIEFLIHCHISREKHTRESSPAVKDAIARFLRLDLIRVNDKSDFETTDRGKKLVEMLCSTPLPEQEIRWCDPRENA